MEAANALAVFLFPVSQLDSRFEILGTGVRVSRGHSDQFALRGHFKIKVGMRFAERAKRFIRHRGTGQRRKKCVVDFERHGFNVVLGKMEDR